VACTANEQNHQRRDEKLFDDPQARHPTTTAIRVLLDAPNRKYDPAVLVAAQDEDDLQSIP